MGSWRLDDVLLQIVRVQGDPFAAPSRVRVHLPTDLAPRWSDPADRVATEDFLLRRFADALQPTRRGSGRSGELSVYRPGPEICERSAVRLHRDGTVEVRFGAGLPARGRRVSGRQAWELLSQDVLDGVDALRLNPASTADLDAQCASVRRQRHLRSQLSDHGLVAFIADGSVLPRRSGVDARPLPGAVPFVSPESLAVTLTTASGPMRGLGVRAGVVVIVGGGFHGKSTVLQALQRGHLDHLPTDGRQSVVALRDTVKLRAEDGRRIAGVDVSAFLGELPGGTPTVSLSTEDASGSTSQAAAITEALESGATVLLLDEDTSATNLLVSDARMRQLIPAEAEPITPLVQRVRQLAERGVSTVLVVGGVADFLDVADVVIAMDRWLPRDATADAKRLARPATAPPGPLGTHRPRVPLPDGLRAGKIRARDTRAVRYGDTEIDLTAVEQVLDASHAWTLGQALRFLHDAGLVDGERSLATALDALDAILDDEGVEALSPFDDPAPDLVRPRRHEVAAAMNRLRTLTWAD